MVVGDDDLGAFDVAHHVVGHQLAAGVVAVRVVWLQHAQPVLDRDAGRHNQEATRELLAVRPAHGVDGLPRDDHGHDRRLARAGGQLERKSRQLRVGVLVGIVQVLQKALGGPVVGGDFGEPDQRFHRFDLAEEGAVAVERIVAPVLEQARRLGRHAPQRRILDGAPPVDALAQVVDDRRRVVLLSFRREAGAFVEDNRHLAGRRLALARLGNGRDELCPAATLDDLLRRLALLVEFPVAVRVVVRRVQDGLFEELILHLCVILWARATPLIGDTLA